MAEPAHVEDVNRGYELYITITVFTVAIILTTTARVIIKLYFRYRLGPDDWFIILGTLLNLVANGFDYKATISGFGRHSRFLTIDEEIEAVKCAQLAVGIANWAIWAVKLSVCFFLLSIMRSVYSYYKWAVYTLIAITSSTALVGSILWGTQAQPLAKLWDPRIPGTRVSPEHFLIIVYVVYAFGCFTDIFYALSPLYFLWSVRLDWKKKLPIVLLTGCGILVLIVGVLNIIFARDFLEEEDITWALIDEFICDIIERNFSAFVANLPALWLLVVQLRKRSSSTYLGRNSPGSSLPYYYSRNNANFNNKKKNPLDDTLASSTITDTRISVENSSQRQLYQMEGEQHPVSHSTDMVNLQLLTAEGVDLTNQDKKSPFISSLKVPPLINESSTATTRGGWISNPTRTESRGTKHSSNQILIRTDVDIREEERVGFSSKGRHDNNIDGHEATATKGRW